MNRHQEAMMGLPSIEVVRGGRVVCPFCGRPATNRHHVVPRSQGGHDGPTVAVCGMGNASGCHGALHAHRLHLRPDGEGWWEWLLTEPMREDEARLLPGWMPVRR